MSKRSKEVLREKPIFYVVQDGRYASLFYVLNSSRETIKAFSTHKECLDWIEEKTMYPNGLLV